MAGRGVTPQIDALLRMYRAALDAADPRLVVPANLPDPPQGRTVVVGVGKAAAAMAQAVEANWTGALSGTVVVPAGAALPLERINDSGTFFDSLGSLVHTGPTHTNVNDFRAILVEPA